MYSNSSIKITQLAVEKKSFQQQKSVNYNRSLIKTNSGIFYC